MKMRKIIVAVGFATVTIALIVALNITLNAAITNSSFVSYILLIIFTILTLLAALVQFFVSFVFSFRPLIHIINRIRHKDSSALILSSENEKVPLLITTEVGGIWAREAPNIELKDQIKNEVKSVIAEVEDAQQIATFQDNLVISREVANDINNILNIAGVNSRAALLLLAVKIENQMRLRLQEAGLQSTTNYALSRQAIDNAVTAGLIPEETVSAFRDFIEVRNKVAHGAAFDVDEATILSLVSIGIELLKIV